MFVCMCVRVCVLHVCVSVCLSVWSSGPMSQLEVEAGRPMQASTPLCLGKALPSVGVIYNFVLNLAPTPGHLAPIPSSAATAKLNETALNLTEIALCWR